MVMATILETFTLTLFS